MEEQNRFTPTKNLLLPLSECRAKDGKLRCVYSNSADETTPHFSVVLLIAHYRFYIEYEEIFFPASEEAVECQGKVLECVEMYIDNPLYEHIEVSYKEPITTQAEIRIDVQRLDSTIYQITGLKLLISDVKLLGYEKPELTVFHGKNKIDIVVRNNMELSIDLIFDGKNAKPTDFLILETQTLGGIIKFDVPKSIIVEYHSSKKRNY